MATYLGRSKVSLTLHTLLLSFLLCVALSAQQSRIGSSQLLQLRDVRKLQGRFWLQVSRQESGAANNKEDQPCLKSYGMPYIERWRSLKGTYCSADAGTEHSTSSRVHSHVQCFAHPEADLSTCLVANLVLGTDSFLGGKPHNNELPQPTSGSIQLACNQSEPASVFLRGRLQSNEGSRAWLVTAPTYDPGSTLLQRSCTGPQAVTHPVLFLLRVDPQNAFHNLEMVVSVFAALSVLQLEPHQLKQGMQVIIADDRQPGYFLPILQRLSWPHPVRILRQQPFPANTCFTTAVIAPYAAHAQSLLTYKAGSVDEVLCESVVLQGASRWLRHLFRDLLPATQLPHSSSTSSAVTGGDPQNQLQLTRGMHTRAFHDLAPLNPTPAQSSAPLQPLYVVWLSRRRFEQQAAPGLTSWQKARALSEEQQMEAVLALQRTVLSWNAQTCATAAQAGCQRRTVLFILQVVELSELSFYPDQLWLMMRTGVLVGVHGAGLANQVFMRPRSGSVVEVWYGMDGNTHYHNMARMLGHTYFNVKCEEGQLDVQQLATQVAAGMDAAAAHHAALGAADAQRRRAWWWRRQRAGPSTDA